MARIYQIHSTRRRAEKALLREATVDPARSQTLFVVPGIPPVYMTGPTSGACEVVKSGATALMSVQAHGRDSDDFGFCYGGEE